MRLSQCYVKSWEELMLVAELILDGRIRWFVL